MIEVSVGNYYLAVHVVSRNINLLSVLDSFPACAMYKAGSFLRLHTVIQ